MIIATAGHVDHGKTALVEALTGKHTDTLEEERRRGLTIMPGFAYFDVTRADGDTARIGFIDVPGHAHFIHNMLAGIAGIDAALLVVAADKGIKPQTVEHLRIMDLLKVRNGLLVITKTDRADADRIALLHEELARFTRGTCMEHARVIQTSITTGEGIDELRNELAQLTMYLPERFPNGNFRLAVDRAFTLKGIGVVATGTVHAGRVENHEELVIAPAGTRARIRGIYSEDQPALEAAAGHRCAINLGGVELAQLRRGDWLTTSDTGHGTTRIDVQLELPADTQTTISHWLPVHVFHGASHVTGRVVLLEGRILQPGESTLAQLVLDEPIVAVHGDTCILRNQAADETIAGARVLDVFAPKRGPALAERLDRLHKMKADDPAGCLQVMLADQPVSIALESFRRNRNLTSNEADALYAEAGLVFIEVGSERHGMHPDQWRSLHAEIERQVRRWHDKQPDSPGIRLQELHAVLGRRVGSDILEAATRQSIRNGRIDQSGPFYHAPGFQRPLKDADSELWKQVRQAIATAGDRPPTVPELAEQLEVETASVAAALRRADTAGLVVPVEPNRYFLPGHIEALVQLLTELSEDSADGLVTTAAYRDASGLGRNLAIAVLEHFDAQGLTRRTGNARRLIKSMR